ncbi:MAG TPA: plastocyanin/azurin family copper-binding protein [Terriglobia bacterium]
MRTLRPIGLVIVCGLLVICTGLLVFCADVTSVKGRVTVGGKPAEGAVIWIEAPDAPRPLRQAVLDQRNLAFSPAVLAVSTGSTVRFPNNDRVLHNVFSFRDGKRFDLGLYPVGQVRDVQFDHAGVSRLFCNIHPGMAAYIVVVDSPYYAVTDRTGNFSLDGVPNGQYTYHAWRAAAATITGKVTVAPNTALEVVWPVE